MELGDVAAGFQGPLATVPFGYGPCLCICLPSSAPLACSCNDIPNSFSVLNLPLKFSNSVSHPLDAKYTQRTVTTQFTYFIIEPEIPTYLGAKIIT